ncbi:hypothetical protein [Jannaschia pohangensis]|uniref:Uncharacterized protein n=1 Tax=Jannaschia pohangensis TaxID=390807 RepID=A0A1I3Q4W7_9RHOB|nr:hypothetical protein [Jannaschia pohangensis]SFJ28908.1 hypothetical protein SAMN04488095_2417 [Jannaschia pohangensis]
MFDTIIYRLWRLRRRILVATVLSAGPGLLIAPTAPFVVLHAVAMLALWSWHAVRFPRASAEALVYGVYWGMSYGLCAALPLLTDKPFHPLLLILFPIVFLSLAAVFAFIFQKTQWQPRARQVTLRGHRVSTLTREALRAGTDIRASATETRGVRESLRPGLLDVTEQFTVIDVETGNLTTITLNSTVSIEVDTPDCQACVHVFENRSEPVQTVLSFADHKAGSILTFEQVCHWTSDDAICFWLGDGTRDFLVRIVDQAEGAAPRAICLQPVDSMSDAIGRIGGPGTPPNRRIGRGPWG